DPNWLALFVYPLEGVGAEAVLVTGGLRGTAVTHQVGDLVCRFRRTSPEIPLHVCVTQAVAAETLLGVDEIWELHAVAQEEGWGVVTHDVVVAVFGVEAQCETVNVTPGIWGALLTSNRGETNHHWGDGVLLEQLCLGELGNVFRNVQFTECTVSLCVRGALWHTLTVEVGQRVDQVDIVEDGWSLWTSSDRGVFRTDRLAGWTGGIALSSDALALFQYFISSRHRCSYAVRLDVNG